ncbi:hypothetical protein H9P43_008317 [Blastocladiella emersonii ATCC 22665]|nr:hypothetical protein H9P43_008317 [Blastocladiella emersonii ATCC 22665]
MSLGIHSSPAAAAASALAAGAAADGAGSAAPPPPPTLSLPPLSNASSSSSTSTAAASPNPSVIAVDTSPIPSSLASPSPAGVLDAGGGGNASSSSSSEDENESDGPAGNNTGFAGFSFANIDLDQLEAYEAQLGLYSPSDGPTSSASEYETGASSSEEEDNGHVALSTGAFGILGMLAGSDGSGSDATGSEFGTESEEHASDYDDPDAYWPYPDDDDMDQDTIDDDGGPATHPLASIPIPLAPIGPSFLELAATAAPLPSTPTQPPPAAVAPSPLGAFPLPTTPQVPAPSPFLLSHQNPVAPASFGLSIMETDEWATASDAGGDGDDEDDDDEFDHSYMIGDMGVLDDGTDDVELATPGIAASASHQSLPSDPTEVTYEDHCHGVDIQGIDWPSLPVSRDHYRQTRNHDYTPFRNTTDTFIAVDATPLRPVSHLYRFEYTKLTVKCSYVHFQLRNLVWAPTKNDVVYTHDSVIRVWDVHRRTSRTLVDCFSDARATPRGPVRISSIAAGHGVVVAGGFLGELIVKPLQRSLPPASSMITGDPNGITNQLEVALDRSGVVTALAASNDGKVRRIHLGRRQVVQTVEMPWAVNCCVQSPDRTLLAVVGDARETFLLDARDGTHLASATGHLDFSFASAWSPCGRLLATGNQDQSARVYDIRNLSRSLLVVPTAIGAVRSLRFSPDNGTLAIAEDADYISLVCPRRETVQQLDFFGEIAGIAFSPDGSALFAGNADEAYGSIVEFARGTGGGGGGAWAGAAGGVEACPADDLVVPSATLGSARRGVFAASSGGGGGGLTGVSSPFV